MSIPQIPGYTAGPPASLADVWSRPEGDFPDELWPEHELRRIVPEPTDWVVIAEHFYTDEAHGGVGSVLIKPADAQRALRDTSWIGQDLGGVGIRHDDGFEDGLTLVDQGVRVEFFCQVRHHHGLQLASVELSQPFLWYWDASGDGNKWFYLNVAGRDEELIRAEVREGFYRVEVKALELRQFLHASKRALVLQHDHVPTTPRSDFERHEDRFQAGWCHFDWVCTSKNSTGPRPGFRDFSASTY